MDLVLRVMKTPGAGPAIGAAEDGARPVRAVDAVAVRRRAGPALRPGNRHEFVAAAPPIRAGPVFEPAAPDHRLATRAHVRYAGRDITEQRRGIGIVRMREDLDRRPRTSTENAPQWQLCGTLRSLLRRARSSSFIEKPVRLSLSVCMISVRKRRGYHRRPGRCGRCRATPAGYLLHSQLNSNNSPLEKGNIG